ncbi:class I SAM-dependent methyltransferase [Salinisphaera sp. USBA-960]|uniref:class I SAM-dependent methyltransferase n=1 Tax=Salinisphaera orenii TaxID=856731 RepID=UPI000DBE0249|nr:class I SAM-dependent methyltransferase [Salifodinibacter halophilus]NNC25876.1 class I SAM-dependent methyltransferase [Salifodinibacter halophilus]
MLVSIPWWLDSGSPWATTDRAEASALDLATTTERPATDFFLARTDDGLALFRSNTNGTDQSFCADLTTTAGQRGINRRASPLARACGLHRHPGLSIFDATAGLGRDSATLASFGCPITAVERHAIPAALTRDALRRARDAGFFEATWAHLATGDAQRWLSDETLEQPDVVLIDPMFSADRRKAKPQKIIAWLNEILGPDADAPTLLAAARATARRRVVVKRHARQLALGEPDFSLGKRAVRFDIYLSQ